MQKSDLKIGDPRCFRFLFPFGLSDRTTFFKSTDDANDVNAAMTNSLDDATVTSLQLMVLTSHNCSGAIHTINWLALK